MSDIDNIIDTARFAVIDKLEKEYSIKWYDICEALEREGGENYAMNAEQFLIEITCKTSKEVIIKILESYATYHIDIYNLLVGLKGK